MCTVLLRAAQRLKYVAVHVIEATALQLPIVMCTVLLRAAQQLKYVAVHVIEATALQLPQVPLICTPIYRVAKMHRMPYMAGLFPQKSH